MVLIVCGLGIVGGCLIFIISSYSHMFSTVFKFLRGADRKKAFSTCVPNIFVVSVFLSSAMFIYMRPVSDRSPTQDKMVSAFYTILTPMLNPLIYSLRNKEVARGLMKVLGRGSLQSKLPN
ncbi:olfactory receptor 14c36-like [Lynx pardinus]|uniref:Olfactory receptor 14c36-like n=1 Tax=Lynx pardinus TaxID=191816 RepID=A0A485NZF6_LYNPA|nr:olfactory receptor 14c36-like [Lynx pardinus]